MSIIPFIATNGAPRDASYFQDSFETRLACGNSWETSLTQYLQGQGLDRVYQPDQYITFRVASGTFRTDPVSWRDRETSKLPQSLYSRFQRDIRVLHNGRGYNLEVKTKSGIFNNPTVLVGGIQTRWERYRFPVHYLVAIDRTTGETRVTSASKSNRASKWLQVASQELSYGVPVNLFGTLDQWLDHIRKTHR
jgi:hypothetical protein